MIIFEVIISFIIVYLVAFFIYLLGNKKTRYSETYHCGERITEHKVKYQVAWIYYASLFIAFDAIVVLIAITARSLNSITLIFLVLITLSLLFIPKEEENDI